MGEFQIAGKDLFKALSAVKPAVERRTAIPILGYVRITGGDGLTLETTNLDQTFRYRIEGDFPAIDLCVDFRPLFSFVKLQRSGELTILSDGDFRLAGFKYATRDGVSFETISSADWPEFKVPEYVAEFEATGLIFSKVASSMSTEETRYYLNGICLTPEGEDGRRHLCSVSTDGHRLKRYTTDIAYEGPQVIVPRQFCRWLATQSEGVLSLAPLGVRWQSSVLTVWAKCIDGTFPDYTRIIPKANGIKAHIPRRDMLAVIGALETQMYGKVNAIKVDFKDQALTATHKSLTGTMSLFIDSCEFSAAPMTIDFNGGYLKDCLSSFAGDLIRFDFLDETSPVLIADDELTYILMPLRV